MDQNREKSILDINVATYRILYIIEQVKRLCLNNNIELVEVCEGPNVLKICSDSLWHSEQVERVLKQIILTDHIEVRSISLPRNINPFKRKRGFIFFLKLADYDRYHQKVRYRFAETNLDYRITEIDGFTLS